MIDIIKLYLPNTTVLYRLASEYGYRFNKEELQKMIDPFAKTMRKGQVEVFDSRGKLTQHEAVRALLDQPSPQKYVYQQFMGILMGDKRNFIAYAQRLPHLHQNVYRMLLRNNLCLLTEVRKALGLPERTKNNYSWGVDKVDLTLVDYINGGYDDDFNYIYYVGVPRELRDWMYEALLPGEGQLVVTEQLPENLQEGCFELSTHTHILVVEALMEQDVLVKGTNKFTVASVKKGVKQMGVDEFFTGMGFPKLMQTLRGSVMLQTMGSVYGERKMKTNKKKSPEDKLKVMHQLICGNVCCLYPILLGHLSGLRPTQYSNFLGNNIMAVLCHEVKNWQPGMWIDVSSMIRCYFQSREQFSDLNFIPRFLFDRMTIYNKFGDEEQKVSIGELTRQIGIPFFKGLLFYMAAWGWLDIGCREYDVDDVSPYDTLEYVRLTALGAYVMGMADQYERPSLPGNETYFELDPDRLIIRSLPDVNPYESLLNDTCIPIGNKRYRMTAETFLAHCKDRVDVQGKIDFFRKYISGDLTQVWTEFFDSLLKRCNPLTTHSTDDYVIYSISGDNQQLIHLLANDQVLRKLVIRAENFIFLVPKGSKAKFDLRLKSLGYLL